MAEEEEKMKDLSRRLIEAEALMKRYQYRPEERKGWLKTTCPKCGYKIQYIPTERWKGRLRCPDCGEIFAVSDKDQEEDKGPTLDDFQIR